MTRRKLAAHFPILFVALVVGGCLPASASASAAAKWKIEGKSLSELGIEKESTSGKSGSLTIEVLATGVKIPCGSVETSGQIVGENKGEETLKLSSCVALDKKGNVLKACPIVEPLTLTTTSSFTTHETTSVYDTLKGKTAETLGTLTYKGEECALGEKVTLKGSIAAELGQGEWPERTFTFSKAIAEAAGASLKYGVSTAFVSGSLTAQLSGAHAKATWGPELRETLLCEAESDPCPAALVYPLHTPIEGALEEGSEALFKGGFGVIDCAESTFAGETLSEEEKQLTGTIGSMSFSACSLGEKSCTLKAKGLPFSTTLTSSGGADGTLSLSGKEAPAVEIKCGELSCTVSGNLQLDFNGDQVAQVSSGGASFSSPGEGSCAKTTLAASYQLEEPGAGNVFMAQQRQAGPTKLCPTQPTIDNGAVRWSCPGAGYTGEVLVGSLSSGVAEVWNFDAALKSIICNESTLTSGFRENGEPGTTVAGIIDLTFSNEANPACPSQNIAAGDPAMTVTVENLPYNSAYVYYVRVNNPQGILFIRPPAPDPIKFKVSYTVGGIPKACYYKPVENNNEHGSISGDWHNGAGAEPSTVTLFGRFILEFGEPAFCPNRMNIKATLAVVGPAPTNVYVTRG